MNTETKETKHTAGPWTAIYGNGLLSVSVQSEKHHICTVASMPTVRDSEAEATARLIAAAPDLLEALEVAVLRVELANKEGNPILSAWLVDARKALAKAKGETI